MINENLPQGGVWELFYRISAVPHISGHEEKLARKITQWADEHGFDSNIDHAGNVIISRSPAPGYENAPMVILQGHLDMVPQTVDPAVDMVNTPVKIISDGTFLHTGGKTTLGADNAIGVAIAMDALAESPRRGGLRAIFTRSEETGMDGAFGIEPQSLNGSCLINLDTGCQDNIYIGCAGGGSIKAQCRPEWVKNSMPCWKIEISGLKGGHSGIDIAAGHGNAIMLMIELLKLMPECGIATIQGGSLSNVIPDTADAIVCADDGEIIRKNASRMIGVWRERFAQNGSGIDVKVYPTALCGKMWSTEQKKRFIQLFDELPLEVVEFDHKWNIPALSANLARIDASTDSIGILISVRAQDDEKKQLALREAFNSFVKFGFTAELHEGYSGWLPNEHSDLLADAIETYKLIFGHRPQIKVIHAGAECGIFAEKQPHLEMISCGPDIFNFHSVNEKVDIKSVERIRNFVFALLEKLYGGKE